MRLSNGAITLGIVGVVLGAFQIMSSLSGILVIIYLPKLQTKFPAIMGYNRGLLPLMDTSKAILPCSCLALLIALLLTGSAIAFLNNRRWGRIGYVLFLSVDFLLILATHVLSLMILSESGNGAFFWGQAVYGSFLLLVVLCIIGFLIFLLQHQSLQKQFRTG